MKEMRCFKTYTILLFVAFALLYSCKEKTEITKAPERVFEGYHPLMDEIIRSKEGVFRGLELNCGNLTIKEQEGSVPTEAEKDRLYYEYVADSTTRYSIDYTLNQDSLEEITLNIFCKDLELCSYLFCDLKDYYASKLPNPIEDQGQVVYNCFEGQRKPFVVSLIDNSTPTKGILNLVIYKDK